MPAAPLTKSGAAPAQSICKPTRAAARRLCDGGLGVALRRWRSNRRLADYSLPSGDDGDGDDDDAEDG